MKERLNSIKLWWEYEGRYYHRDFITGVKNLWNWFPTIWKDRDWDTHYIWEIFKFKLQNQAKYIGDNDRHMSAKRDAEKMRLCVKLMDRLQTEHYSSEYTDYKDSKFHFVPIPDSENYEMKSEILREDFDTYFAKYPRIYKQVMEMENPPFKTDEKIGIAINIAHINHNRARKLLFKILESAIERRWD